MKILQVHGADGKTLCSFVCEDESQAPTKKDWQSFIAQQWQINPASLQKEVVNSFPALKLVEYESACCFGPPFYDENGNPMADFKFPETAIWAPSGNGSAHLKYSDGKVIWFNYQDFTYMITRDGNNYDPYDQKISYHFDLKAVNTLFGVIAFKGDFPLTRMPEIKVLLAHKAYPAMIHRKALDNKFIGFIFYDGKWEKVQETSDSVMIFSELYRKEFRGGY